MVVFFLTLTGNVLGNKISEEKIKKNQENLQKRRIARREKYRLINENPEKYAIEKANKKQEYLKRKREKKIRNINELSPREQRIQRKKWRQNSQRYHEKKKEQRKIQEVVVKNDNIDKGDIDDQSDPLRETIKKEQTQIEIKLRKTTFKAKCTREKNEMLANKPLNRKLLMLKKK